MLVHQRAVDAAAAAAVVAAVASYDLYQYY